MLVAVDENEEGEAFQFERCKVYRWSPGDDESWDATGMIGQFLHPDALGRFVYTRFAVPVDPNTPPEPGMIPIRPAGIIEHLLQYRPDGDAWKLIGERSLSGLGVRDVIPGFGGRWLFVDAERGMRGESGFEVPVLDAIQIGATHRSLPVPGGLVDG